MTMIATQVARIVDAQALGFASFNEGPHLLVEAPDGNFTVSVRTSNGEQITFSFVPYKDGGPAGCVDIQRHTKTQRHPDRPDLPTFDMIGFAPGTGDVFDTRKITRRRMTLATVLLEDRPPVVEVAPVEPTPDQFVVTAAYGAGGRATWVPEGKVGVSATRASDGKEIWALVKYERYSARLANRSYVLDLDIDCEITCPPEYLES